MNIEEMIGTEKIINCADMADDQSSQLICDILDYFNGKFSLDEKAAWNQFRNALEQKQKDSIRNQIFKTAILLKIQVPSNCF